MGARCPSSLPTRSGNQGVVEVFTEDLRPKDGCLSVVDSAANDYSSTDALTAEGLDYAKDMLAEQPL